MSPTITKSFLLLAAVCVGTASFPANAGCGAAFCALNTHWETQGAWSGNGTRLDLRYEYIDLDQPRTGREKISVGEIRRHHDEVRTLNRNLVATLDHALNADWGISLQAPYLQRDHYHIHNHHGAKLDENWDFSGFGDIRVLGRYRFSSNADRAAATGLIAGLKLPTGETDVSNADGKIAEPGLQPGTGTTDLIAGIYTNAAAFIGNTVVRHFMQVQAQYPLNVRGGFRPGNQLSFDTGLVYPAAGAWGALLQLNAQIRERDRGPEAEPQDSGGSFIWLSPGLSYAASHGARIYGFVQLPLYQRVNGVQITAGWAVTAGISGYF